MKQFLLCAMLIIFTNNLFSQERELQITDTDNDGDAVIQLNSNDPAASNYMEMILGFNPSNQTWLRTTTNHDLSFWTNNTRKMTIKNDGKVGIGTSTPSSILEVNGDTELNGNLIQSGSGNSIIESTNGTITITTNSATIEVLPNGNINILSAGDIDVDATGNLNLSAAGDMAISADGTLDITAGEIDIDAGGLDVTSQSFTNFSTATNFNLNARNHSIVAESNIDMQSGNDLISNIGNNYNLSIGGDQASTISGDTNFSIGGDFSLHAQSSEQTFDTSFSLSSTLNTSLNGGLILLNSNGNGSGAARIGDTVTSAKILTGSTSVLIGN